MRAFLKVFFVSLCINLFFLNPGGYILADDTTKDAKTDMVAQVQGCPPGWSLCETGGRCGGDICCQPPYEFFCLDDCMCYSQHQLDCNDYVICSQPTN